MHDAVLNYNNSSTMPNNAVRLSPLFPTVTARRADHPQNAIKAEVGPAIKVAGQQIRAGDAGSTGHAIGTCDMP